MISSGKDSSDLRHYTPTSTLQRRQKPVGIGLGHGKQQSPRRLRIEEQSFQFREDVFLITNTTLGKLAIGLEASGNGSSTDTLQRSRQRGDDSSSDLHRYLAAQCHL